MCGRARPPDPCPAAPGGVPARSAASALSRRKTLPTHDAAITGAGTFLGGILHTLPFLIPQYRPAVLLALAAIAFELLALAWIRRRFFGTSFLASLITVTLGGAIIATISAALGALS